MSVARWQVWVLDMIKIQCNANKNSNNLKIEIDIL